MRIRKEEEYLVLRLYNYNTCIYIHKNVQTNVKRKLTTGNLIYGTKIQKFQLDISIYEKI